MLKGVKIFDLDDNRELFGSAAKPGEIYAAMDKVADFQVAQRLYKAKPDVGATLNRTFVLVAPAMGSNAPK
jgi:NitT/TauT family transport system substrate-binding protein